MISADDYCQKVCKAKCCRVAADDYSCRHLQDDCKCNIYYERFGPNSPEVVLIGIYRAKSRDNEQTVFKAFSCGRILNLIENKKLDPEIEKGCCYAHPELLEGNYL